MARLGRAIWRVVKAVLDQLAKLATKLGQAIWRVVKATPKAAMIVLTWIWDGMKSVGGAVAEVGMRVVALLHTALVAVFQLFRTITLQDVINGCKAVLQAVFVSFPQAVVGFFARAGRVAYEVLKTMFGCAGQVFAILVYLIWLILTWPPRQVWKMLEAAGRSARKGVEEILVWMDPKRMP
ncbi:hypothetical protein ACRALDRAFT_1059300 [Sodiomyces alcalophilus JCM 7366]|uniref:uncharacterized protein n=1 Tax=Sodiomyces alcalophilus JCM 7366 TaxID=591952 RepID=UPI0039B60230